MTVLVDSSVWIEYFRAGHCSDRLDYLIDENLIVTNDLILTELIPFLKLRNQKRLITLLEAVERTSIEIDWEQLVRFQYRCLKNGINGVGIPDLIIAQNAKQNNSYIFSPDNHFTLLGEVLELQLYV